MNAAELKKNAKDVLENFKLAWEEYVLALNCSVDAERSLDGERKLHANLCESEPLTPARATKSQAIVEEREGLAVMANSVVIRKRARLYELIEELVR